MRKDVTLSLKEQQTPVRAQIITSAPREEVLTRERCHIQEILNHDVSQDISLARARVEQGISTERHILSVNEQYIIESGQGLMEIGDETPAPVSEGDIVQIPKGMAQRITNIGNEDLVFLCLCQPRFKAEYYTSLEEKP